jgi:putative flavoprotein involved in K+ transport
MTVLDVVVVGGGQAGLGMGYCLQEAGRSFVILERGRIGETWRSQRWDSFAVNTPNWTNGLPGDPYDGDRPDGFYHRDELVAYFERYAAENALPVREGVSVTRVDPQPAYSGFVVTAQTPSGAEESIEARNVVVASGSMQSPKVPTISERFPASLTQLHAADYRSPDALPDGAVVVVGGGQSGCQVAEDLINAGRTVYLCTSKVARLPRRYRDRDILEWAVDMGFWDVALDELPDPAMQFAAQPQVSGVGRRGSTVSLQHMAHQGVKLMGRLSDVVDGVLITDDSLAEHIAFADEVSAQFKADIDAYIAREGIAAPEPDLDPIDAPAGPEVAAAGLTELDLDAAGVASVIWCTGFTASFDWLPAPAIGEDGHPIHTRGVGAVPGIYFLGFPWLHSRKSGVIFGIEEDARYVTAAINSRL